MATKFSSLFIPIHSGLTFKLCELSEYNIGSDAEHSLEFDDITDGYVIKDRLCHELHNEKN